MEMMQFHPTGLIAGDSVLTGTVLEEGLRGAGGHLVNVLGERFMARYDPVKMERSTRDRVSRSSFMEVRAGRGTPEGGVFLDVRHLGRAFLQKSSPGMYKRCLSVGYDMAKDLVQVTPTAHFQMGGVRIDSRCRTSLPGLYAAGEDAGGVHGANRLGGNGVAESIVFGAVAGDAMARDVESASAPASMPRDAEALAMRLAPRDGATNPFGLRRELGSVAWDCLGIVRSAASLAEGTKRLAAIAERLADVAVPAHAGANASLQERMNIENLLVVANMIAHAATSRDESRGSHYREDFPDARADRLYNLYLRRGHDGSIASERRSVRFCRREPHELLGETRIADAPAQPMTTEV
jgi:succinate dehydrogenase / fumarate reductase flavoprotein subunit/fumarate reductase flavoprotein subunit